MTEQERADIGRQAQVAALRIVVQALLTVVEADRPGLKQSLRESLRDNEDMFFQAGPNAEWAEYLRHRLIVELDDLLA